MDAFDLLLDENGDLQIESGDFIIGRSDEQHIDNLLLSNKGEWRHSPSVGVGLKKFLNGTFGTTQRSEIAREIRIQLEADGFIINELTVEEDGNLNLNAVRT